MMKYAEIASFVHGRILALSNSKAALAKLRRGIGKQLGEIPEIMGYVFPDDRATGPIIDNALYTAITLYALHQQGNDKFMGDTGEKNGEKCYSSFGSAVQKLVNGDNEIAVKRRFDKVLTSTDLVELSVHARSIVNQLSKAGIPLDYSGFAVDLVRFQNEETRREVVVKWGKDYYFVNKGEKN